MFCSGSPTRSSRGRRALSRRLTRPTSPATAMVAQGWSIQTSRAPESVTRSASASRIATTARIRGADGRRQVRLDAAREAPARQADRGEGQQPPDRQRGRVAAVDDERCQQRPPPDEDGKGQDQPVADPAPPAVRDRGQEAVRGVLEDLGRGRGGGRQRRDADLVGTTSPASRIRSPPSAPAAAGSARPHHGIRRAVGRTHAAPVGRRITGSGPRPCRRV